MNRVYFGPPGTGKTFTVQQFLKKNYEGQFTSEQLISEQFAPLTWWEACVAALYDLKKGVTVPELKKHPFIQAIFNAKSSDKNLQARLWGILQSHAKNIQYKSQAAPFVFEKSENSVWRLAEDAKESCAEIFELVDNIKSQLDLNQENNKRWRFVTFHQSYGYEEFVEGLRPVLKEENDSGEVQYEIHEGIFKEICRIARSSPNQRFAMVIDEINRGNISKIFGELITLIESDKREGQANEVSVVLPYSHQSFSVPSNVDIIGTMNTADRSLALLDTALRRRFEFVAVYPQPELLRDITVSSQGKTIDLERLLKTLNARIEALYDREHTLGHAYFMELQDIEAEQRFEVLKSIFKNKILPLLEEYFFDDWQKIRLTLGDNQKNKACQIIQSASAEDSQKDLFGNGEEAENLQLSDRYEINEAAFNNVDSYIGIYAPSTIFDETPE
jgi:5-methylcytosine-specific restriction protein B